MEEAFAAYDAEEGAPCGVIVVEVFTIIVVVTADRYMYPEWSSLWGAWYLLREVRQGLLVDLVTLQVPLCGGTKHRPLLLIHHTPTLGQKVLLDVLAAKSSRQLGQLARESDGGGV